MAEDLKLKNASNLQLLTMEQLVERLKDHGFNATVCSTIEEHEIDGEVFLELTEKNIREFFPKFGNAKKVLKFLEMAKKSSKLAASNDVFNKSNKDDDDDDDNFHDTVTSLHDKQTSSKQFKISEVPHLKSQDFAAWLSQQGLAEDECQTFKAESISGASFMYLSEDQMKKLATRLGSLIDLLRWQKQLKELHKEPTTVLSSYPATTDITEVTTLSDFDSVDVATLDCNTFIQWLTQQNIVGTPEIQVLKTNQIDGETFLALNESDFKEILPQRLGIIRKLCLLQKTVLNERSTSDLQVVHSPEEQELNFENPDDVAVATLDSSNFSRWLQAKKYPIHICQSFKANQIDGETFLTLKESDFKEILPQRHAVGIIRKLCILQRKIIVETHSNTVFEIQATSSSCPAKQELEFKDPDSVDVETLDCASFSRWLEIKEYPVQVCQSFRANQVDGETFLTLKEKDFREILPQQRLGIIKRLLALQQKIMDEARLTPVVHPVISPVKEQLEFENPDDVTVSTLDCASFSKWLSAKGFAPNVCQLFKDHGVHGKNFLMLEKSDLRSLIDSVVVVAELHCLQKEMKDRESVMFMPLTVVEADDDYRGSFANLSTSTTSASVDGDNIRPSVDRDIADSEVPTLGCQEFASWLLGKGFPTEECKAFQEQNVDGDTFLNLTEDEIKDIVQRVGSVRKLRLLQTQINNTCMKEPEHSDSESTLVETKTVVYSDPNEVDVLKLGCEELIEYLTQLNLIGPAEIQSLRDLNVNGEYFMSLTDDDFNEITINIGIKFNLKDLQTKIQKKYTVIPETLIYFDNVDVSKLDDVKFAEWLKKQQFSLKVCRAFKGHKINGELFLRLSKEHIHEIVNDEETVLKLAVLQQLQSHLKGPEKNDLITLLEGNNLNPSIWLLHFNKKHIHQPNDLHVISGSACLVVYEELVSLAATNTEKESLQKLFNIEDAAITKELVQIGFDDKYWLLIFKGHLGITTLQALKCIGSESYPKLVEHVRHEWEKKLLLTLLGMTSEPESSKLSSNDGTAQKSPLDHGKIFENTKEMFMEFLEMIELSANFPKLLTIKQAMIIRQETIGCIEFTKKPKIIPFLILQKIMMFDSRRTDLFQGKINHGTFTEIHPVDSFLALLHCCDNFLCQDLLSRLATCQKAIPLLLPNPYDRSITLLLWAMRSVIKAWKCPNVDGDIKSQECRITEYPAPIISFLKFGQLQQSKSKIINEVISESRQDFFFNWDCEGATSERKFVDGLVEMCCYLPSGKMDFFNDMLLFLNLRGDAQHHHKQLEYINRVSCMCFVFLNEEDLTEEIISLLNQLPKPPGGIVVMLSNVREHEAINNKEIEKSLKEIPVQLLKFSKKNYAQIRKEIRNTIRQQLKKRGTSKGCKRLNDTAGIARQLDILVDEDDEDCVEGKRLALRIMENIQAIPVTKIKETVLPLQGPALWHEWARCDKESFRQEAKKETNITHYDADIERKKQQIRNNQLYAVTPIMLMFVKTLSQSNKKVKVYFLQWLKMLLDDHSRLVLPDLQNAYQHTRAKLLKTRKENKTMQNDSEAIIKLKSILKSQNEELVQASFGLEHFFRELAQMYESRMDPGLKNVSPQQKGEVLSYPQIIAELMNEGYAIELMDGDASHVPVTWVLAVIDKLSSLHNQKQRIFVISVLGIQSTGKSTLLNTLFGLRFNVSAGRCTRGAYFQLLALNKAMSKKLDCDYVMIVDTEGLRAPELQYKESQKHDNELATFVIGLADITIINIYGETPGELTDILQTAVHAFIRMKRIDMQLSCNFVHQNVTAVMADAKSKVGRQNFQDKLDDMTKIAAKIENCEFHYRSFQDVIHFNDEVDVTFFPSLWSGDPPMAPVNPGYSDKASLLKQTLINVAEQKLHSNFRTFQLRVKTLWQAVLREKFVFSFKNTLEVNAYNELDTERSKWSWSLQRQMLDWQHQTANRIRSCDVSQVDSIVEECIEIAITDLNSTYSTLNKQMTDFFESSEKADTLEQWRKRTEVSIQNLCDDHKDQANKYCTFMKLQRLDRIKVDNIQQTYRQQLQVSIDELSKNAKKAGFSAEQRQKIFDAQWDKWITELSTNNKHVKEMYESEEKMEISFTRVLEDIFAAHKQLVVEKLKKAPLAKTNYTLQLEIDHANHLNPGTWKGAAIRGANAITSRIVGYHLQQVSEDDVSFAKDKTSHFLFLAEELIEKILKVFQGYNKGFVSDLLKQLLQVVNRFNTERHPFRFSPQYKVDLATTVAGYTLKKFTECVNRLRIETDPVEALKKLKDIFFRSFETQFSAAANDQTAARNLCGLLSESMEISLVEKLKADIVTDMKFKDSTFQKKVFFKVQVMKDLARKRNFKLYDEYLSNISLSLKYWAKVYVDNYCAQVENGMTKLSQLAELFLNKLVNDIRGVVTSVNVSGQLSSLIKQNERASSSSTPEETAGTNESCQSIDMMAWLDKFHEKIQAYMTVDLQKLKEMIGVKTIHNLQGYAAIMFASLGTEVEKILVSVKDPNSKFSKVTEWEDSPHLVLYNSVTGCKEQCPFCKEQCEITDEKHLPEHPHYIEIHRPRCLGKRTWASSKKLVLDICTVAVEDPETSFINADTSSEGHKYKDYKDIYPDWRISTESPKEGPKYWEWFVAQFNSDIVKWASATPTPVKILGWQNITDEDALDSLSQTYDLQTTK